MLLVLGGLGRSQPQEPLPGSRVSLRISVSANLRPPYLQGPYQFVTIPYSESVFQQVRRWARIASDERRAQRPLCGAANSR
ncbi:hypothetical protein BO1005MUT1_510007 [Hyphomicrobiales bacterium]|nr:hypothetical protein BO1005MUT1_510007 [Hyphomicrobiales bacterium]